MKRKEIPSSNFDQTEQGKDLMSDPLYKKAKIFESNDTMLPQSQQKSDKYDRQLRLWGENGQQCLENSHIVVLNATTTAMETLKCLVLPGIGRYSIVDNTVVTVDDISSNFFIKSDCLGMSRSKVCCELLQELNEDCVGSYQNEQPIDLLERDPAFFKSASVVIASRMNEHDLHKISNFLWSHNIPLVICETYGWFSQLAINLKEHVIIEAHPDNALEDLRLDMPFHSLKTYMDAIDLKTMNKLEHSHTPFLVILYKYLEEWKQQTGETWPKNYKQKMQIKQLIQNGVLKKDDVNEIEENFDEAIQNVNNAFVKTVVPSDVLKILNDPMTDHPLNSNDNAVFWILARSLREFVKDNETLPLRGNLPDMFSDSKRYIDLQTLYKEKSDKDIQCVYSFAKNALLELQLPDSFITEDQCKLFCKNASFLKVLRGVNIIESFKENMKLKNLLENMEENHAAICLLFHAVKKNEVVVESFDKLANTINSLKNTLKFENDVVLKYANEVNRCKLHEVHSVSAIMGGIAAQEIIKIVTKQFVPCDNLFVYDGINNSTASYKM